MKVEKSTVTKLTITEAPALDPIDVFLEDFGPGKGSITIKCYGQSWTASWGGMGPTRTVARFFMDCDKHYLASNLSNIRDEVFDPDKLLDTLKREVVGDRKRHFISRDEARDRWERIEDIDLPETVDALWHVSATMVELLGDEWWCRLPMKPNPDYLYLCRIIDAVRAALKQLTDAAPAPLAP